MIMIWPLQEPLYLALNRRTGDRGSTTGALQPEWSPTAGPARDFRNKEPAQQLMRLAPPAVGTQRSRSKIAKTNLARQNLCGVPQPEAGHARLSEMASLDVQRHDLGVLGHRLWLVPALHIRWSKAIEGHVRPPSVVPSRETSAEFVQMAAPTNQRNPPQPLLLQRPVHPLGHRNAAVLAYGTESLLRSEGVQKIRKISHAEPLVGDQVLGRPHRTKGLLEGLADTIRTQPQQGLDEHQLPRKMVDK